MSRLSKIKAICKSLANEFGDTIEGHGYNMLFGMLEKEEKSYPGTIRDLIDSVIEILNKYNIKQEWVNLEIHAYRDHTTYQTFLMGKTLEYRTPKAFYEGCKSHIEQNYLEYKEKEVKAKKDNDLAL